MNTDQDQDIIIMKNRSNVILTCGHPTKSLNVNINWNITTPLSGPYVMQENYTNSDYKLYSNGSIKIYYQFLLEKSYIVVKCSLQKSRNKTYYLWEHATFTKSMYVCCKYDVYRCTHAFVNPYNVMLCMNIELAMYNFCNKVSTI